MRAAISERLKTLRPVRQSPFKQSRRNEHAKYLEVLRACPALAWGAAMMLKRDVPGGLSEPPASKSVSVDTLSQPTSSLARRAPFAVVETAPQFQPLQRHW